jgi:predicted ATPase
MTVKRLAIVGAGGVGKSTLMKLFEADGWKLFPSITREFYDIVNVKDEAAYMAMGKPEQAQFQRKMRMFYKSRYTQFLNDNPALDTITDRSIFDHMAYGIYGLHDQFTTISLQTLVDQCVEFANKHYTHFILLPYPQPWMHSKSIEDGFRQTDPAKNYCVWSLMFQTIMFRRKVQGDLDIELLLFKQGHHTPEEIYDVIREGFASEIRATSQN